MNEISAAGTWFLAGVVLAAKTGIDYRKLKKGEID